MIKEKSENKMKIDLKEVIKRVIEEVVDEVEDFGVPSSDKLTMKAVLIEDKYMEYCWERFKEIHIEVLKEEFDEENLLEEMQERLNN